MSENDQQPSDVFRDTPVRLLGYANEVGESFRRLIPVPYVILSYAISTGYCLSDAGHKGLIEANTVGKQSSVLQTFAHALIWQGLASVILPGFTINRICWLTSRLLTKRTKLPLNKQKWMATSAGLCSIPLIVRPIDCFVDGFLERVTTRFSDQRDKLVKRDEQKSE